MSDEKDVVVNDEVISAEDDYDMFDDSEVAEEAEAETAEPEEKGEEAETEETAEAEETGEAEEEESPSSEHESGLVAAKAAETKRRQAAEERARLAEDKLKQYEKEEEDFPDPVTDPEGYAKHIESKNSRELTNLKIEMSEEAMRDAVDDFDEMQSIFFDIVAETDEDGKILSIKDPALQQKFLNAKNPAKFAYEQGKKQKEFLEVTAPGYKDSLREQLKAEILEELKGSSADDLPSLTSATATASNSDRDLEQEASVDWD